MGVKVRFVEERWVKSNGTKEKVKLETPCWAVMVDYKGKRKFIRAEGKREALTLARDIGDGRAARCRKTAQTGKREGWGSALKTGISSLP